jgi:putative transposase
VDVWTGRGLTRFAVLFIIDLSTRRIHIAGIAPEPDAAWMSQSRNLTDAADGFLMGKGYLIHDRDPLFTVAFRETLAAAGVQVVRLPPRSPNLNAYAERFVRTIKESCLDRMILVGEGSLRRAVGEFIEHYHRDRNHQGLGNQLIVPVAPETIGDGRILSRERLSVLVEVLSPTRRVTAAAVAHRQHMSRNHHLNPAYAARRTRRAILPKARSDAFAPRAFQVIDG